MCLLSGPEHVFALANARYLQVVGNRRIVGLPIRAALPEIEGQGFLELLDAVYATGEPVIGREARVLLARGPNGSLEEAYFDYIYAPVRDARGQVEGIFVHGFEVTELVRARQRFEAIAADNARLYVEAQRAHAELDQQRRAFLSAAAHDLRTPIAAIRAASQLARRRLQHLQTEDTANVERLLARIEASTHKVATLIDELLDISRLESAGELGLNRSATDLAAVARRVIAEHQPAARLHTLRLVERTDGVMGQWDAIRLERLVDNLVANAIKFSPDGGEVVVTVGAEHEDGQRWATLWVQDPGLGIRPEDLGRIFHRFERGANVGQIPGSGIGLAYVRDIATQHGGTISVTSALGRGSTFTLRLPLGLA
jgi:signal transduction histidine kinase